MPGDEASSARQEPGEFREEGDSTEDEAGFLFGPDGEEEPGARGSIATLAGPTAVSGVVQSDRTRVVHKTD